MTHAQLTPEIIHDLLVSPLPTIEICTRHKISVADLRALVESPQFRRLLADLEAIDEARRPAARRRALDAIERIAALEPETPGQTETVRKAAAQIVRATQPGADQPPSAPDKPTPVQQHDPRTHPDNPPTVSAVEETNPARSRPHQPAQPPPPARAAEHPTDHAAATSTPDPPACG